MKRKDCFRYQIQLSILFARQIQSNFLFFLYFAFLIQFVFNVRFSKHTRLSVSSQWITFSTNIFSHFNIVYFFSVKYRNIKADIGILILYLHNKHLHYLQELDHHLQRLMAQLVKVIGKKKLFWFRLIDLDKKSTI